MLRFALHHLYQHPIWYKSEAMLCENNAIAQCFIIVNLCMCMLIYEGVTVLEFFTFQQRRAIHSKDTLSYNIITKDGELSDS